MLKSTLMPALAAAMMAGGCSTAAPRGPFPPGHTAGPAYAGATRTLFSFEHDFTLSQLRPTDARVRLVASRETGRGAALRVDTGHTQPWPGVVLKPPAGPWDLSRWSQVLMDVWNIGHEELTLCCRVDSPGADGVNHCHTFKLTLPPGGRGVLGGGVIRKRAVRSAIRPIGMRGPPPGTGSQRRAVEMSKVSRIILFVPKPDADHAFVVDNIVAAVPYVPPNDLPSPGVPFFPMIDEFGQYVHKSWPGKTHSPEALASHAAAEGKDLAAHPGPAGRNRYGGWADGPLLETDGFFRVAKVGGTWWLVDPAGRLFWSQGIDCVRSRNPTPITHREGYFRNLPAPGADAGAFYAAGDRAPHGYYSTLREYRTYDFTRANLLRKYGRDWERRAAAIAHRRLRSWGLNTIGNWSDPKIRRMRRTPYVGTIHYRTPRLEGSKGYWVRFPDVFDPGFRRGLRDRLDKERGVTAGDPWCIGYFVDNELSWGTDTSLAVAALASGPKQAAKRVFLTDLKAAYGDIAKLNAAWGTSHRSWEAMLQSRATPDAKRARADLLAFNTRIAETYFRTIAQELRRIAPNQLYLGCRFAWVNDTAVRAAAAYCDVISYNRYTHSVAELRLPEDVEKPVIIGEFHFGALDRGLFHTGLRAARDQAHRAELYEAYVRGALRNPLIVGTHWFQYLDQPTTGRIDGENYQIGFLDICDRPYPPIVAAARRIGETMYSQRASGDPR